MTIVSFTETTAAPHVWAEVSALQQQAWPGTAAGHDPQLQPVMMALQVDGVVVAALGVLSKDIEHRGASYRASGLSGVVTDQRRQRSGYGSRLVRAARQFMAGSGVDLALFSCDPPLVGFYAAAGFRVLPDTVIIGGTPDDPLRSDTPGAEKVALGAFFSERVKRAEPDFEGAQIDLYPGPIDRLW